MTVLKHIELSTVIVRLDRTIQYSEALLMETISRGVLDPPVLMRNCAQGRGMTALMGLTAADHLIART